MAKKRGKTEGGEELIAGVLLRRALEFLCHEAQFSEHKEPNERWFEFDRFSYKDDKATTERLAREMVARGWIEPVQSRAQAQRYKLTDAGRRYAAESQHLFKWPAAQSQIRRAAQHGGRLRCLIHLHNELSRSGMTTLDVSQVQQSFLGDLEDAFDEEALAAMYDWWNYNHEVIAARGRYVDHFGVRTPAAPRIDLTVFLSSKDNLVVEWCPTGMRYGQLGPECDWLRWRAERHRHVNWDSRPSNELLFIHEVQHATGQFPGIYSDDSWENPTSTMINAILLQAAAAMIEELKDRLKQNFEVRMVTDVFTEWEEIEAKDWPNGKAHVLASWKIVVEARNKKASLESPSSMVARSTRS